MCWKHIEVFDNQFWLLGLVKKGERNRDKKDKKVLLRDSNDDRNKKEMIQERKEGKTNNLKGFKDKKMLKEKRSKERKG